MSGGRNQRSPIVYAKASQWQLQQAHGAVPVYAAFNRNWANEPTFVTWHIREIHQEVYPDVATAANQSLKGIDRPVLGVVIHSTTWASALQQADNLIQYWHGYQGNFGNPATTDKFDVRKLDVHWLYNTYDNEINLHQIHFDVVIDIPS
jgi:hypothetical protein